jgi:hypothetical protein
MGRFELSNPIQRRTAMTSKKSSNNAPSNPRQSDRGAPQQGQQQQNQQKMPRHQGGQRQP